METLKKVDNEGSNIDYMLTAVMASGEKEAVSNARLSFVPLSGSRHVIYECQI